MSTSQIAEKRNNPLTSLFLVAYAASCVLFWWIPSILLHFWLGLDVPIEAEFLWISVLALLVFAAGYFVPVPRWNGFRTPSEVMDRCEGFAYKATLAWAIPAFAVAIQFTLYRLGVNYGEGHGLSLLQQAILYIHLFLGLLYVGIVDKDLQNKTRLVAVIALTVAPRVLVSLRWGRFFAAQAIVPILFIAVARGWLRLSFKRSLQISVIGLFLVFVPALTRGDEVFGEDVNGQPQIVNYFGYMNSLIYIQDDRDIAFNCQPLLVSLGAKVIPFRLLGMCTIDVGDDKGLLATLDQLLTKRYTDNIMAGTASNYLLELYLFGGNAAIFLGTLILGIISRWFVGTLSHPSLYAGIWAECLSRVLLLPRGDVGYIFERIPSLLFATLLVVLLSWAISVLQLNAPQRQTA